MKRLVIVSIILIVCGVSIILLLPRGGGGPAQQPVAPSRGEPDAVYQTRGRIAMLPGSSPTAELQIHHEPIDAFVNPNGTVGMPAMIMPFPLAADSTLEGLAVGDAVEFEFAVWSKPGERHYEARRLRKLPPDTKLDLPG